MTKRFLATPGPLRSSEPAKKKPLSVRRRRARRWGPDTGALDIVRKSACLIWDACVLERMPARQRSMVGGATAEAIFAAWRGGSSVYTTYFWDCVSHQNGQAYMDLNSDRMFAEPDSLEKMCQTISQELCVSPSILINDPGNDLPIRASWFSSTLTHRT